MFIVASLTVPAFFTNYENENSQNKLYKKQIFATQTNWSTSFGELVLICVVVPLKLCRKVIVNLS